MNLKLKIESKMINSEKMYTVYNKIKQCLSIYISKNNFNF
jgi:hypothetical protein